jgi:DNA mismatch repair ATPase MutS
MFEHNLLKYHLNQSGEVKEDERLLDGPTSPLRFLKMKIMFQESGSDSQADIKEVIPLFKAQEGVAEKSFGLSCAAIAGVRMDVLERALYVSRRFSDNLPLAPWLTEAQKQENEWLGNILRKLLAVNRSKDSTGVHELLREAWRLLQEPNASNNDS